MHLLQVCVYSLLYDTHGDCVGNVPMKLGVDVEVASGTRHRRHNLTATIGLVVHAAGI